MDRALDFANVYWGKVSNPNNATQTHSIFVKISGNNFCGMPKIEQGQFLANSESSPILRLL